jgi:hypothetical protein
VSPQDGVKSIKFGILGAAAIAPAALIYPAKSHLEAVVYAVAARDTARAEAFAKKHKISKAYGGPNGYQGATLRYDKRIQHIHVCARAFGRPRGGRYLQSGTCPQTYQFMRILLSEL